MLLSKKEYEDFLEYQKIQKEYFKKYPNAIKPALISQLAGINIHEAHMMILDAYNKDKFITAENGDDDLDDGLKIIVKNG
tara:strand:+ start:556 stop:795 length:240 start_codon:yes stop_codon:yes gene_type:complete